MIIRIFAILTLFLKLAILYSAQGIKAETVEIVSNMYTEEILAEGCFKKLQEFYELRITDQKYNLPITTDYDTIKRYLLFNINYPLPDIDACPAEKKVLFLMEPVRISPEMAQNYSRIYTWDDDIIDNEKYFKYYFPDLMSMISNIPSFADKKLCTMIVRNWHPEHRRPVLEFFSEKPKGEFEFYGSPFPKLLFSNCYKGRIPGNNCGPEKINVLKNYRYCFCFENRIDLNGYISEKIFPCFAAGCVPIYWGAPNIEDYIPKECYIDYRDFQNLEELYLFLKAMTEDVYENYLDSIRMFLSSEEAQRFSPENFSQTLFEAVSQ